MQAPPLVPHKTGIRTQLYRYCAGGSGCKTPLQWRSCPVDCPNGKAEQKAGSQHFRKTYRLSRVRVGKIVSGVWNFLRKSWQIWMLLTFPLHCHQVMNPGNYYYGVIASPDPSLWGSAERVQEIRLPHNVVDIPGNSARCLSHVFTLFPPS